MASQLHKGYKTLIAGKSRNQKVKLANTFSFGSMVKRQKLANGLKMTRVIQDKINKVRHPEVYMKPLLGSRRPIMVNKAIQQLSKSPFRKKRETFDIQNFHM